MRRKPRKDTNHKEIVQAALKCGLSVLDMASLGNGAPDVAFGYGGLTMLVEIKDGEKPPSQRKLTPDEQAFAERWTGSLMIVQSVDDVLRIKSILVDWSNRLRLGK